MPRSFTSTWRRMIVSSRKKKGERLDALALIFSGTLEFKFQVPGVASVPYCGGGFEGGVWVVLPLELPLGLVLLPVLLEPAPVLLEPVEPEPLVLVSLLPLMLESLDFFL